MKGGKNYGYIIILLFLCYSSARVEIYRAKHVVFIINFTRSSAGRAAAAAFVMRRSARVRDTIAFAPASNARNYCVAIGHQLK